MILKKPYAFLIKYFKIIHLILLLLIVFTIYNFNTIVSFFTKYNLGSINVTEKMATNYVSFIGFLTLFIIIIFSIFMFLLMNNKQKPKIFYVLLAFYYLTLLILFILAFNRINMLYYYSITQQSARAYRDIYLILSLPNYYFLIISFIRGIGFDIKKFNFKKDLDDLEISSKDNEEFEFVLGSDIFKYKRKVRRFLRETKYYILENKALVYITAGILLLIVLVSMFLNTQVFNKKYGTGASFVAEGIKYTLNTSFTGEYNFKGKLISNNKTYVIVDLNLLNSSSKVKSLSSEKIFLNCGSKNYYNKSVMKDYFSDLGETYTGGNLKINRQYRQLFIFEVNNNDICSNYDLKIYKNTTYNKNKEATFNYYIIRIKPKKINYVVKPELKNINEVMYLGDNLYDDSSLKITEVKIDNSFEYEYQSCNNNKCSTAYNVEKPENSINQKLMIVSYTLNLNKSSQILTAIGNNTPEYYLFNKILQLSYEYNEKSYTQPLNIRINNNIKNKIFVDVPRNIENYSNLKLNIITRERHYYIDLS